MSASLRRRAVLATAGVAGLFEAWARRSRATRLERRKPLPGDELVPYPKWQATRAITIQSSREEVWPWLAQMGYPAHRAGWYIPHWIDRVIFGIRARSADHIVPELQTLAPGDRVPDSPDGIVSYFTVEEITKNRALVLISHTHPLPIYRNVDFSWAFVLDDGGGDTRLLMRARISYTAVGPEPIVRFLIAIGFGIGDVVQAGAMLGGIKGRAQSRRTEGSTNRTHSWRPTSSWHRAPLRPIRQPRRRPAMRTKARQRPDGRAPGTDCPLLERVTPLDVSNLRIEQHGLPMNVGALAILEQGALVESPGELDLDAIRTRIEDRLHLAPRLRQRLYWPGFGFGAPVWVDDAGFDISRHVRTRPVPAPGGERALLATCVELNDRRFDRAHPLWEIWFLIEWPNGRVSMLVRFHHVLADGLAALMLLGVLFDAVPEASVPAGPTWRPRPVPTRSELLRDGRHRGITALAGGQGLIEHPRRTLARGGTFLRQAAQFAREGRAPPTSFNRPVGKRHRLVLVRADLERARQVSHAHHATVNDVVLCAMAGGARALLAGRAELHPDLVLEVSVAASVRAPTGSSQVGNRVGILLVPLPVGEEDPIRRLEQIARATAKRKHLPPYQPAARFLQRWMIRSMNRQRRINLLMSNLPGPPQPMYFAGAKILEVFQIGVVQGNVPVQIGVLSYAGQLNFDIAGDADVVPDLDEFARGMVDDLERLSARSLGEDIGAAVA